jgi:AcrR family transcriptional regulator
VSSATDKGAKRDQIIVAAIKVFGRYSYKRSSMELIAQAAGVSRPAIYQYFSSKEDVFRAMGAQMLDEVILAAETVSRSDAAMADRLYGALAIKLNLVVGTVDAELRSELLTEAGVVAADLMASFKKRYVTLIEDLLASASAELDLLDKVLSAHDCAALLLDAITGITQEDSAETAQLRLRQLVDLTLRSLTSKPLHGSTVPEGSAVREEGSRRAP